MARILTVSNACINVRNVLIHQIFVYHVDNIELIITYQIVVCVMYYLINYSKNFI